MTEHDPITEILKNTKTIAVIGLTANTLRPSYEVSRYMQQQGYRIIPVNPKGERVLGEQGYPSLAAIPGSIDVVNVFRRAEAIPQIVDEVIALGEAGKRPAAVWIQEGIVNQPAAAKARQAGYTVVMDRCILKEHRQRATELRCAG